MLEDFHGLYRDEHRACCPPGAPGGAGDAADFRRFGDDGGNGVDTGSIPVDGIIMKPEARSPKPVTVPAPSASGPPRPSRGPSSGLLRRVPFVLGALVFCAAAAWPLGAAAETLLESMSTSGSASAVSNASSLETKLSQTFMTGANTGGYTLGSVSVWHNRQSSTSSMAVLSLWSAAADDVPGSKLHDFTSPSRTTTTITNPSPPPPPPPNGIYLGEAVSGFPGLCHKWLICG